MKRVHFEIYTFMSVSLQGFPSRRRKFNRNKAGGYHRIMQEGLYYRLNIEVEKMI